MITIDSQTRRDREELFQPESDHIIVSEKHVSFGGVKLDRAENRTGSRVINPRAFNDFIDDPFSIQLQQDIATSFSLSQPMLIEAGTSIGKSTTVKRMASLLGWEMYSVNFTQQTDVDDFMGRYVVNPKFGMEPNQPENIFQLGRISQALISEDGKTKVILLDEYNAASGGILIALHDILDQYSRGGDVMLPNGDYVTIDKSKVKIVACMNPPTGYQNRNALDPAQMRRWNYFNLGEELPKEIVTGRVFDVFNLEDETTTGYKGARERRVVALEDTELAQIPKLKELVIKYIDFHYAVKAELKKGNLAGDQAQEFTYDDQELPKKVKRFITEFYNGDINETIQTAIYFYYVAPLSSAEDRKKVIRLAKNVSVKIETDSRRVSVSNAVSSETNTPPVASEISDGTAELRPDITVEKIPVVEVQDKELKGQSIRIARPEIVIQTTRSIMGAGDPWDYLSLSEFVEEHYDESKDFLDKFLLVGGETITLSHEKICEIISGLDISQIKYLTDYLNILLVEKADPDPYLLLSILLRVPQELYKAGNEDLKKSINDAVDYVQSEIDFDKIVVLSRFLEVLDDDQRSKMYTKVNSDQKNLELFLAGLDKNTPVNTLEEIFDNLADARPELIIKYIDKFVDSFPEDITEKHKEICFKCLAKCEPGTLGYSHLQRLLLMGFGERTLNFFASKFDGFNSSYRVLTEIKPAV